MFREQSRTRFLNADEMKRFLGALDGKDINPTVADIVRLSLFTGARRSNCAAARSEEFDLTAGTWTVPASKSKNGQPMVLPLVPQAAKVVRARMRDASGFLFPSYGESGHVVEVKSTWTKILAKAKLADTHFHDLRRSFGSWQAAGGASLQVIGKSLGHRHLAATEIYSRLDLSAVRKSAGDAVQAMLNAAKVKAGK